MLTELRGKGGCLCQPAKEGSLRCPLIVRPTAEDVITGELVQVLRTLNPHWWLADFLNEALGRQRFFRQVYRRLRIELWQNMTPYPRELLPWDEGSTQVDCVFSWENPPTTIYLEAKYGSQLSAKTSGDDGRSGFPSDQLVRNARVGLFECGYFRQAKLFPSTPRDFVLVLITPRPGNPLVRRYRDPDQLRSSIPHSDKLSCFPRMPFIGEISFRQIKQVLRRQLRWFTRAERLLVESLSDYLDFKQQTVPNRFGH